MSKKIFVGMSGGVDSSLSAALLQEEGYSVTGVYMKNWTRNLPGFVCSWEDDFKDAKTVALQLGIDFKVFDFESSYRKKVVDYMLNAYVSGLTPNPDIVCNQEIKFKLFLDTAIEQGADYIATGHYARVHAGQLYTGLDASKDQSYFLYRISGSALKRTIFPLGELKKYQVRKEAQKRGLITAAKPDSQGICFVGEVGIKQFLLSELGSQRPGEIIDQKGKIIGEHDGALFYTIGQRHGLNIGGGLPYYVTHKDMQANQIFVTTDLNDPYLWSKKIELRDLSWIDEPPIAGKKYGVKCRYRSDNVGCIISIKRDMAFVEFDTEVRAVSPGQSAVIYENDRLIGGGTISKAA